MTTQPVVRTLRPRQWLKNALVFGAPAAAGVLTHGSALWHSCIAFLTFCMAASGTYCVNDVLDREADRIHPTKRNRPIASGLISARFALGLAAGLFVAALGISFAVDRPRLALVLAVYVAVTIGYSLWLKHEALFEIGAVSAGFVLRAIAGGIAVPVPLSNWFLIVACFGSLFVVTGKREAELMLLGSDSDQHRPSLAAYTPSFLRYVRTVSSAVLVTGYCLWAFENPGPHHTTAAPTSGVIWFQLSIIPFVFAVFRYGLLVDAGHGGAPEDVVIGDRTLQMLGACMMVLFAIGVYR